MRFRGATSLNLRIALGDVVSTSRNTPAMSVPRSHRNRTYPPLAAVGPDTVPPDWAYDAHEVGFAAFECAAAAHPRPDLLSSLLPHVDDLPALLDLDTEPLPDEDFDWSGVDAQDRAIVAAVLERCDAACDDLLDTEFRTIARRILAMLATRDPRPLRRTTNHDRLAAGIVWLAGRGNGEFGRHAPRWRSARTVADWFGVTNCADRGQSIRKAAGLVPEAIDRYSSFYDATPLGSTALLHSRTRRSLIGDRDTRLRLENERRRWTLSPDGKSVACRAERAGPLAVTHAHDSESNEAVLLVALGGPGVALDEADLYGLSLPDARRLMKMLRRALPSP
jgi:hypothetical protein